MSEPGNATLRAIQQGGLASPDLFVQKIDPVRNAALVVGVTRKGYAQASFLDDRIFTPQTQGTWISFAQLQVALASVRDTKPLQFIFHAGHVGSTLLSRLVEEGGGTLHLREPLTLRTLAEISDWLDAPESLWSPAEFDVAVAAQLKLWSRGYADTKACIVKATSTAGRLGQRLLAAAPVSRAIYLSLAPEPFLAALLSGENSPLDLRGHAAERARRLRRLIATPVPAVHQLTLGGLAAMAWLTERLIEKRLVAAHGDRVLSLDFDVVLADLGDAVARVARHFGIELAAGYIASVPKHPLLARYAKATEHAYSPALRAEILAQSRARNAAEIKLGLDWLERIAAADPQAASVFP
ncbi:MAG: hypothetical protein U1E87_05320 [Alphaproteobacteria bacterium]